MRVETSRFGVLEVDESTLFDFPMGLPGFARHKRFVVVDHTSDSPFKWMQCVDDGALAFIISDPCYFIPEYHVIVRRSELRVIEPKEEEDLVISVIMTVPENPKDMSANLMAPLVFNMANRRAMQMVLTDQRYPVKYFVLREGGARQPLGASTSAAAPQSELSRSISLR